MPPAPRTKLTPVTDTEFKKIRGIVPMKFYVVNYVDGTSPTPHTRIVAKMDDSKQVYFVFPEGTEKNMKPASAWLAAQFNEKMGSIDTPVEASKDTGLPSGDPTGGTSSV